MMDDELAAKGLHRPGFAGTLIGALSLFAGACTSAGPLVQPTSDAQHHELLDSVLWTQTAVEFDAVATGAYALAALRLDEALANRNWTAALEQMGNGDYREKPPAVVLDIDETVLDNSAYEARLIAADDVYRSDTWGAWVQERAATAVPGALEFTRYAASKGVAVFYVTNRDADLEAATRDNLRARGFPLDEEDDRVLTRGERPEWDTSDKSPRRAFVADRYRLLLLVGDDFGDFSSASRGSIEERTSAATSYTSLWGRKWIVLPNAMYGSWEAALYGFDYGASEAEKRQRKREALRTNQTP
jgi:acid phosphatase